MFIASASAKPFTPTTTAHDRPLSLLIPEARLRSLVLDEHLPDETIAKRYGTYPNDVRDARYGWAIYRPGEQVNYAPKSRKRIIRQTRRYTRRNRPR